jgi:predicted 3-demethylubiquinone-9 3-methyltransferase (glyoxalase superfamily)
MEADMQKITPFLWFNDQAEEAAKFYTSIFRKSKIKNIARYGDAGPGPKGSVMVVSFEIEEQEFNALNGGPIFKFTPAISFVVNCRTQAEVDRLWEKLSAGGEKGQCGWLTDKYGVSWQIVPTILGKLVADPDPVKSNRVMQAMLKMNKIDIATLRAAYGKKSSGS